MSYDRDAALKRAERLLRQGRLDGAIAEYVRLVDAQPNDWGSINTLGDLYLRVGDRERAVAQFNRVADHLYQEGFLPKAAALYKKALKAAADHEHTLVRLSDIAARQGLLADARTYLRQVQTQRTARRDDAGVAECRLRLGTLEDAEVEAQIDAARAALDLHDPARASALFLRAADELERTGRLVELVDVLADASHVRPDDADIRRRLAQQLTAAGDHERIRHVLGRDAASDDPDLLLVLGRAALAVGDDADAWAVLSRVVAIAPEREPDVLTIASELAADGHLDRAYRCVEIAVDSALLDAAWDRAVEALEAVLHHGPYIPALARLVEVASEAGAEAALGTARERLVDAYLAAGLTDEALVMAEILVAQEPARVDHQERLRRALELSGVTPPLHVEVPQEPDARVGPPASGDEDSASLREPLPAQVPMDVPPPVPEGSSDDASGARQMPAPDEAAIVAAGEVDTDIPDEWPAGILGVVAADILEEMPGDRRVPEPEPFVQLPADLLMEDVTADHAAEAPSFDEARASLPLDVLAFDMFEHETVDPPVSAAAARPGGAEDPWPSTQYAEAPGASDEVLPHSSEQTVETPEDAAARAAYARALDHLDGGRLADAVTDLQMATHASGLRFAAAARLGRLYAAHDTLEAAIQWLECAAATPAPTADEGCAVLYDLGDVLERAGEHQRALAIFMGLDVDPGSYRDVRSRIHRLVYPPAGSENA